MKAGANTLEQLCEPGRKITYGVVKPGHEVEDGVRFIRGGDVFQGRIAEDVLRTISPQLSEQYKRTILRGGELLVSLVGNPGEVAVVPERLEGANIARQVGLVPLGLQANHNFVMYFLRSPLGRAQLFTRTQGAVQQVINLADLKTIEVPDISLDTQGRIASILAAYDDLIENNQRRIQLLDQAARLLFKEWFVHLRFPGHEHVKIKDGVPEGWERKKIANICETVGGGTPSTKVSEYWEGDITWVVPSDITKNDCLALLDSERKITEKGLRESSAKMVPAETILMTSRASVGFFALMDYEVCTNQGFINIIPHDGGIRMYLLFNLMSRVEEIRSNAKGTTFTEISKGRFREMNVVVPTRTLVNEFAEFANDVIRQVRNLKKSTLKLERARDLLLPRLMNGEVAV